MIGEKAVRLSAISIWSDAASSPCLMIEAVTGSTVVVFVSAVWVVISRLLATQRVVSVTTSAPELWATPFIPMSR